MSEARCPGGRHAWRYVHATALFLAPADSAEVASVWTCTGCAQVALVWHDGAEVRAYEYWVTGRRGGFDWEAHGHERDPCAPREA
jgi:hypothetical protein